MQLSVVLFTIHRHHKSEVKYMHAGIRRHNAARGAYADAGLMATDWIVITPLLFTFHEVF